MTEQQFPVCARCGLPHEMQAVLPRHLVSYVCKPCGTRYWRVERPSRRRRVTGGVRGRLERFACIAAILITTASAACNRSPVQPTDPTGPASITRVEIYEGLDANARLLKPGAGGVYTVNRRVGYTARIFLSHSRAPDRYIQGQIGATFYVGVLAIDFQESTDLYHRGKPIEYVFGVTAASAQNAIAVRLQETGRGLPAPVEISRDIPVQIQ